MPYDRRMRSLLRLLVAAVLAAAVLCVPALAQARMSDPSVAHPLLTVTPADPLHALLITSGLTWADIDPHVTPNLDCFAKRSGVGAMSLTSGSVMTTKRQGIESLQTGVRAAPLSTLDGSVDFSQGPDRSNAGPVPTTIHGVPVVDLGSVDNRPDATPEEREASLRAIDAAFEREVGFCGRPDTSSTLGGTKNERRYMLASIGIADPPASDLVATENQRDTFNLYAPLELQVVMDSRYPGTLLTSTSTRQPGLITNLDVTIALMDSSKEYDRPTQIGSSIGAEPSDGARGHVRALSAQAVLIDRFTPPAVGTIALLAVVGGALLAFAVLRGPRPFSMATGCAFATAAISMVSAGFIISAIPWGTSSQPGLLFAGGIMLGGLAFAMIPLLAVGGASLWRARRMSHPVWSGTDQPANTSGASIGQAAGMERAVAMPQQGPVAWPIGMMPAIAAAVLGAVILLDSLTGSRLQLTSLLGNQPLYGGRFYGISNHLAGILLAAWIMGLIALFAVRPALRRRWRVLITGLSGLVVLLIAALPRFGADAGSAILFGPVLILALIAVAGVRLRTGHLFAALAAGGALVVAVAAFDYLRGPDNWSHLGLFISTVITDPAAALAQQVDRVTRMLEPLWVMPLLAIPVVLAIIAVTVLVLRSRRMRAWDAQVPGARGLRTAGMLGAWFGALTNDTGLVLLTAAYVLGTVVQLALVSSSAGRETSEAVVPGASSSGTSSGSFGER